MPTFKKGDILRRGNTMNEHITIERLLSRDEISRWGITTKSFAYLTPDEEIYTEEYLIKQYNLVFRVSNYTNMWNQLNV